MKFHSFEKNWLKFFSKLLPVFERVKRASTFIVEGKSVSRRRLLK